MKYITDSSIAQFKVRLVAENYFQISSIDFIETFASTVRRESLYIYLALCIILELIIYQVNIINIYLESLIDDNKFAIYMKLMLRINNMRKGLYCRLLKSFYNLK